MSTKRSMSSKHRCCVFVMKNPNRAREKAERSLSLDEGLEPAVSHAFAVEWHRAVFRHLLEARVGHDFGVDLVVTGARLEYDHAKTTSRTRLQFKSAPCAAVACGSNRAPVLPRPGGPAWLLGIIGELPFTGQKRPSRGWGSNSYETKNAVKIQSVIIGIFDNAQDLDRAVEGLAAAGFEDTIYDEAIVEEPCKVDPVPVGPVLAVGAVVAKDSTSVEPDLPTILRAFKSRLADYHLPAQVIEAYATTFYHKGKFTLVRTDRERAEQAMEILRECHASRVNRHD